MEFKLTSRDKPASARGESITFPFGDLRVKGSDDWKEGESSNSFEIPSGVRKHNKEGKLQNGNIWSACNYQLNNKSNGLNKTTNKQFRVYDISKESDSPSGSFYLVMRIK